MISANQERFSKVILAVDGSEHSLAATRYLTNLPISPGCKICVLTVLDTPHTPRRQLLLAALEQACDILRENHMDIEYGLLHGHPAASLVDFADDYHPNLIVLGAKGLRATLGILLGGIAQQVAEYANWPVLVIRPLSPPFHRILIAMDGSEYSQALLD
jgi:nucleotide-binding universal stress UspA family protein